MKLIQTLEQIKQIASQQKFVESVYIDDCYNVWQSKSVKYGSVVVSVKNVRREDNYSSINLILYYGDRLKTDDSNAYQIYDDATVVLRDILNQLEEIGEVEKPYTIELFKQQFTDYLAGAYVDFYIDVPDDLGECSIEDD